MVCKNCGFDNNDQSQFCVNCGTVLEQPQQAQQPNYQQPYNQPNYQQPYAPQYNNYVPYQQSMPIPGKGLGITSMVLGIISFFCASFITGILAIIFGGVAKSKGYRGGMATAGIVCGIISIALLVITIIATEGEIFELYEDILDEMM
ncbi:MAG: DUF4190 domain-containing protein [Clostridia bacterium]|nr:DUF4190 domain-containing protein [Clostridia bacterium]